MLSHWYVCTLYAVYIVGIKIIFLYSLYDVSYRVFADCIGILIGIVKYLCVTVHISTFSICLLFPQFTTHNEIEAVKLTKDCDQFLIKINVLV